MGSGPRVTKELSAGKLMRYEHRGVRPVVHPTATVAPTAVLSGDVTIGPETRVLHGAVLTSEGGRIAVGRQCVVMENAVLRGTKRHPLTIGDHVLVGPRAYLSGCTIERSVFLATGTTVFNGAVIGTGSEVRVNGTVHLLTELAAGTIVPIDWVAVGRPARLFPPDRRPRTGSRGLHEVSRASQSIAGRAWLGGRPGARCRSVPWVADRLAQPDWVPTFPSPFGVDGSGSDRRHDRR